MIHNSVFSLTFTSSHSLYEEVFCSNQFRIRIRIHAVVGASTMLPTCVMISRKSEDSQIFMSGNGIYFYIYLRTKQIPRIH